MKSSVTVIVNSDCQQYFFTIDHCQRVQPGGVPTEFSGEEWVAVTHYLPSYVVPRPGCSNGIINTVEKLIFIFYKEYQEIPNPNPDYAVG